jgi:hypothetical protein
MTHLADATAKAGTKSNQPINQSIKDVRKMLT